MRPSELSKTGSLWGSTGVVPDGVNQGSLGDCWFLAGASAIAEFPDRLKKIVTNSEMSNSGVYEFNFFSKGWPKKVTIDDRLPTIGGAIINTKQGRNGSWWMALMEKAYTKMNVNYFNIKGGSAE